MLFDAYATLSLWKDLDAVVYINARWWIAACLQCWKIVACFVSAQSARGCSDSYHSILLRKWPSTVLHNNIPLQSTLTPCVV